MARFSGIGLVREALAHQRRWPRMWRSPRPKKRYDIIVVGAGGHGLATAYYLAKVHKQRSVAVLEKGWLGGGNTGRNTTIVRSNYLWDEAAHLYEHAMKLWEGLSQELNYNVMFSQRGVMNLGHTLQDMRDIERRVNANRLNGIDGRVIEADECKAICPLLDTSSATRYPVMGASWQPRAGVARHDAVAWGYARAADALGVDIIERCEVTDILVEGPGAGGGRATNDYRMDGNGAHARGADGRGANGANGRATNGSRGGGTGGHGANGSRSNGSANGHRRHGATNGAYASPAETDEIGSLGAVVGVETREHGRIEAGRVGCVAAGSSSLLAAMAGFRLPLESHPLQAYVSEPIKPILDTVVMSNAVHGYMSQSDKGDLVIGAGIDGYVGYGQRGAYPVIEHTMQAIVELFPFVSRVHMNRQWGGIVDTTPDACPILSRTPVENLFFNCGWGTGGFKATPGSGHVFADLLANGEPNALAAPFDLRRFHDGALIDEHGAAGVAH